MEQGRLVTWVLVCSENGEDSETRETFSLKPAKCAMPSTAGKLENRM